MCQVSTLRAFLIDGSDDDRIHVLVHDRAWVGHYSSMPPNAQSRLQSRVAATLECESAESLVNVLAQKQDVLDEQWH